MHRVQAHVAPVHVVQQPPGGGHDNLRHALEGVELLDNGLPAVEHGDAHLGDKGGQLGQLLADLHGKLSGGAEHHFLDALVLQVHVFQHGNAEGAGFPRARGGNGHDVHAAHHQRNGLGLHGGRLGKAHFFDGLEHLGADVHLIKTCNDFF